MKLPSLLAASLLAGLPALAAAQSGTLLVLSKHDHTLSIVDPVTLKVIAKAPVGDDPHEVIASEDGRTAYVSNYGFGQFHTLAVVDLVNRKALPSIDLGPVGGAHGLAVAQGKTYFTSEVAKAIGRYDPATGKIDMVLGTGQDRIHMIYVTPDGQKIVTTNVRAATVTLTDREQVTVPQPPSGAPGPEVDWEETQVKVGHGSEGFDISPDGREIWVANAQDGTVSVIDWATKTVTATLDAGGKGANRLKFTLDGKQVLLSSGPNLIVMDVATHKVTKRIPIGHGSAGILMEPGGKRAFVACSPDNYVAVIDLATMAVAGHIEAGGEPDGMAWAKQN